jgi:hypothetical protein
VTVQKPSMSVGKAILIGQLLVNVPVFIIMIGLTALTVILTKNLIMGLPGFIVGFVIAWLWWSFTVPRWRRWAHRQGVPPAELQKWAVATSLVWPKGWIFEKTEFKVKDD